MINEKDILALTIDKQAEVDAATKTLTDLCAAVPYKAASLEKWTNAVKGARALDATMYDPAYVAEVNAAVDAIVAEKDFESLKDTLDIRNQAEIDAAAAEISALYADKDSHFIQTDFSALEAAIERAAGYEEANFYKDEDVKREEEVVIPMSIRIKESGEYALRLTHTNDSTSQAAVFDKETGAKVELQSDGETSTYLFLADEGDSDRFDLIISKAPKMVTDLDFVETLQGEQAAQVFVRGENLCLKNIPADYSVSICDVLGREYVKSPIIDSDMTLPLPAMRGVYVVNILDKQNISVQSVKVTK